MQTHHSIDYVEIPSRDLNATKTFFSTVFAFSFTDFGPDYTAFDRQGLDGGFFKSDSVSSTASGSALVILFTDNIVASRDAVTSAGGTICQDIFEFPGGQRFHFLEPGGSEFAVWAMPS